MFESWGTLAYELVLESFLASALFWVVAVPVTRLFGIKDTAWRARFFLLPVLLPVTVIPLIHLVIRPLFLGLSPTPLENFLTSLVRVSPLVSAVFLSLAALLLLSGAIHALRPLAAAGLLRLCWRYQCQQKSPLWLRCNNMLQSISSKLRMSPARLVLTKHSCCGSLALGPLGSYVVVSEVLLSMLDEEELEGLLTHELGHIKRKDTLLGVVVGICHRLLTISPFAQSAYRRFSQAWEEAVDDLAIRATGRPLALASCLVKACRLSRGPVHYVPISGLLLSTSAAYNRIQRLLGSPANVAEPQRWYHWVLFLGVIALAVASLLFTV